MDGNTKSICVSDLKKGVSATMNYQCLNSELLYILPFFVNGMGGGGFVLFFK